MDDKHKKITPVGTPLTHTPPRANTPNPAPPGAALAPTSNPSPTSYVYPIRSLLSGKIQPDEGAGVAGISMDELSSDNLESLTTDLLGRSSSSGSRGNLKNLKADVQSWSRGVGAHDTSTDSEGVHHSLESDDTSSGVPIGLLGSGKKKRGSVVVDPNFRHYPAGGEDIGSSARTFATAVSPTTASHANPNNSSSPGPGHETPEQGRTAIAEDDFPNPQTPPDDTETDEEREEEKKVEGEVGETFEGEENSKEQTPAEFFNPSEYGLVHLPPLPPSPGSSPRSRSNHSHSASVYYSFSTGPSSYGGSSRKVESEKGTGSSGRRTAPGFAGKSVSVRTDTESSEDSVALVSFRFEHKEDESGNYVIVGREGKLTKCEDEPIRTPGAVQGFGVLIVVDEGQDSQTLVVRQVSENSSEILGLSPKYLFSLDCFTDVLSDSQAEHLWDNIQFLNDPEYNSEEEEDSPHVFLLSGHGQPGSASDADIAGGEAGRKSWSCWCAVHRPAVVPNAQGIAPNLIIMEFELEKDVLNPLYPPAVQQHLSGEASPFSSESGNSHSTNQSSTVGSGSGSGQSGSDASLGNRSSNTGSDTTLVVPALSSASANTSIGSTVSPPTENGSNSSNGLSGEERPAMPRDWSSSTLVPSDSSPPDVASPPVDTQTVMTRPEFTVQTLPSNEAASQDEGTERVPSWEDILESTTSHSKPLLALERLRRMGRAPERSSNDSPGGGGGTNGRGGRGRRRWAGANSKPSVGMMDIFAVMGQINEQLGSASNLDSFLKVTVGLLKDLTQFHRVLVYQFDELWNGQVVAELVDWSQTHELYRGLHFPASDIPAQARQLYAINKVRLLYDRSQSTARIVCRSKEDLDNPLNMTHCFLRAMSPIHVKYLGNMGVRASMSVSIMAFGALWGLVTCHSYGDHGMRVSFPVRQMLRLLSQSISKNIERLSYAQRLHTRKLINTLTSENHPTGYIVSNADDLLGLFDADFGILVIGEGAKILGPNVHGQEILIIAEYLRLKRFGNIQASQAITADYPDLNLSTGLEVIAGLLYVPLSHGGKDFIAFLRQGAPRHVHWAGKPFKDDLDETARLEPRESFKIWSETVAGRCRHWTDEQLETAGVLALVYGKFIEVWRQKETAMQATRLTNLLLSNASHEVRTPLNHIINYLEMALNSSLDKETRENLKRSHAASKSLLFTINDLLDLTRLESGHETSFNEPFDLHATIMDAISVYQSEALRRNIAFKVSISQSPSTVVGDSKKIRTVIQNLTANSLKYTEEGSIAISCTTFGEPDGLRGDSTAVEIVVADTGCGIAPDKLESIFREFEQVESASPKTSTDAGVGLGLAVVARIVEQLGGQLRVDSKVGEGSRFSFLIPLALTDLPPSSEDTRSSNSFSSSSQSASVKSMLLRQHEHLDGRRMSGGSYESEVDSFVEAISQSHLSSPAQAARVPAPLAPGTPGTFEVTDSGTLLRPVKLDSVEIEREPFTTELARTTRNAKLRVLVVEDDNINRLILAKRLKMDGHTVVNTTNGQEGLDMVKQDPEFDCILMDIQMPLLNGFEATERIRLHENQTNDTAPISQRLSQTLNGRIPIFAVSASLKERQREELQAYGLDGWILKPIDFKRLSTILRGVVDPRQRDRDVYRPGCSWEIGGWLNERPASSPVSSTPSPDTA